MTHPFIHPYMPNSVPEIKKEMLDILGVEKVEDLYENVIPEALRFKGKLNLPEPLHSELDLENHMNEILNKNRSCQDFINFLGAGCYQHFIPAVCHEINSRAEFLTAYCGDTYSDHGKMQAIFEYCSMMAELLDMDVVSYTNYDGGQAAASSLRMAMRITQRQEILLPETMNPEILSQIRDYCRHLAHIQLIKTNPRTGQLDRDDLQAKISSRTAAVFIENPNYLGAIEERGHEFARLAHEQGALFLVYADPISLGLLEPPAHYGADIVCGDIQPLGIPMHYGGGCAGFIATPHEKTFIQEIPTYLYGIARTKNKGEYGWGRALNERCSHGSRENAREYFGTECGLWAITAGVYLALMGPQGLREVGETIVHKVRYTRDLLSHIPNIEAHYFKSFSFKEFVVNFDKTGKTTAEINAALLDYGIFGGKDLTGDFPQYGQSALFCVTEVTSLENIKALASALQEITGS